MKLLLKKGTTSYSADLFIQDSSSTVGAGRTGLLFNTSGLTASYKRPAEARSAITLATQTVTGAYSSGGFVEVDSTNMPGVYRLDLPDAVLAAGKDSALVFMHGAANMAPMVLEVQLTDIDVNDGVRAGLTSLPNAAADAAGGLPISDAGGLDMDAILADTNELQTDDVPGLIAALNDPTAAAIADAVWDELQSAHVTVGSFGEVATEIASILADTNELQTDDVPGLIAALNDLSAAEVNAEVDTALNTAIPVSPTADSINERIAAIDDLSQAAGAGDLAAILTDTADMQPKLGAPAGASISADIATVDTVADAVKAKTDSLTFTVANQVDANMLAISGDTTAADNLEASAEGIVASTVNDASATTTSFVTNLTEATDDHYNGRYIVFRDGVLAGQASDITDYNGTTKALTVTALTEAPGDGDAFVIL